MDVGARVDTDQVGMALYAAGGVVVAALAAYGHGIGTGGVAAFAVAGAVLVAAGLVSESFGWGVGLPMVVVAAALAAVHVVDPAPFTQRLAAFRAVGASVAVTGAVYLVGSR